MVGSAESVPGIEDGTADLVVAAASLHWMDHQRLGPELRRILKPKGHFIAWSYPWRFDTSSEVLKAHLDVFWEEIKVRIYSKASLGHSLKSFWATISTPP